MLSRRALSALVVSTIAFAGCSAGSAGVFYPSSTQSVQFVISVPEQATPNSRTQKPQFTAPSNTQSVSIALSAVNGAQQSNPATIVNVSSSSAGCTSANNALTCTANVPAQVGADTFTLKSYSQPNAGGTLLATGSAQVSISAGQTSTAPVTVGGTVASVALSISSSATIGTPASIPVTVIAKDATGAVIMGAYVNPITLSDSDTSGVTKLSATKLGDSSAAASVTLTYNGTLLSQTATISASSSSVAGSAITNATFAPAGGSYFPGNGTTNTYTETSNWVTTPSGGSPQTQSSVTTIVDTYSSGVSFNGMTNLIDVHRANVPVAPATEVDSLDTYINLAPASSGVNAYEVGYERKNQDNTGVIVDEVGTYTGSGALLAELPLTANNSWNSAGAYSNIASGSAGTASGTYKADGSFTYTSNDPGYGTMTETVNADGSGSYTDSSGTTTYGVPTNSGGTYVIPVTSSGVTTMVPDWFPGNAVAPSPVMTDRMVDKGSVALPAQCTAPSSVVAKAELIEETISQLDPVYGDAVAGVADTYYVSNVGTVCSILSDTIDSYDNMNSGVLLQRDVLTWTDVLAPKTSAAANTRTAAVASGAAQVPLQASVAIEHDRLVSAIEKSASQRHSLLHRHKV